MTREQIRTHLPFLSILEVEKLLNQFPTDPRAEIQAVEVMAYRARITAHGLDNLASALRNERP